MKDCVQWNPVRDIPASIGARTRDTRSAGQRLTHLATGAPKSKSMYMFFLYIYFGDLTAELETCGVLIAELETHKE